MEVEEEKCRNIVQSCDERRRWEELPIEILANIFKRLNVRDLMFMVPLVCTWWNSASMDPTCWMVLDLRLYTYNYYDNLVEVSDQISVPGQRARCFDSQSRYERHVLHLAQAAANRAGKHILHLIFPSKRICSEKTLIYISERTPKLKRLGLPRCCPTIDGASKVFCNWSQLEAISGWFSPQYPYDDTHIYLNYIFDQIGVNCKKLTELRLHCDIRVPDAIAIANNIPKLEFLDISMSNVSRVALSYLLEHCRELKHLNISHCNQFEETSIPYIHGHHVRNIFDSDLIQEATSLLNIRCCSRQVGDFCEMCYFVESKGCSFCLHDVGMLGEIGYACDAQILIHEKFIPYYVVAVLSDNKQRFYHYFNTWIRREKEIRYQRMYPESFQEGKDMDEKHVKMEKRKMEMTKKSYPYCGIM